MASWCVPLDGQARDTLKGTVGMVMEVKSMSHKAQWPPPEAEGASFCLQTFEDQSCELHWESPSAGLQAASGITCLQECLEGFRHHMTVGPAAFQCVNTHSSILRALEK